MPPSSDATKVVFTLRRRELATWNAALGAGDILATPAVLLIYADDSANPNDPATWKPFSGITPDSYGTQVPALYFSDEAPHHRLQLGVIDTTAANGSALLLDADGTGYSAASGQPPGCSGWSSGSIFPAAGTLLIGVRRPVCP